MEESSGFLESIWLALEPSRAAVTKVTLRMGELLSAAERELLLALPALESLAISGSARFSGSPAAFRSTLLLAILLSQA